MNYVQFDAEYDQHPNADGSKSTFQHLEEDGTEVLKAYLAGTSNPTAEGAEGTINAWIGNLVEQDVLDDVPYIVSAELDEGEMIVMVSDADLPLILYANV